MHRDVCIGLDERAAPRVLIDLVTDPHQRKMHLLGQAVPSAQLVRFLLPIGAIGAWAAIGEHLPELHQLLPAFVLDGAVERVVERRRGQLHEDLRHD